MTGPQPRPVELVLADLLAAIDPLGPVEVPLEAAIGSVLVEDVTSQLALPAFDNAAMDGFAVRWEDLHHRADPVLRVVGDVAAGTRGPLPEVGPDQAVRIATGAPLPPGADTVVRVERATTGDGHVTVARDEVAHGADVRRRGEDLQQGDVVVTVGTTLGPGQIAALSGTGHRHVRVHRRPDVTVVLTGDEVRRSSPSRHGDDPHGVPDALGAALRAVLSDAGAGAVQLVGPVGDDGADVRRTLQAAADTSDLVVTVGGISRGHRDLVPGVLDQLGEVSGSEGVALRPGRPFRHGRIGLTPVLCLPGNPAAALVAAHVFARPAVALLHGVDPTGPDSLPATLCEPITSRAGSWHWLRAVVHEGSEGRSVRAVGRQGASMLHSLAAANAWLLVPPDVEALDAGATVRVVPTWGDTGRGAWRRG